MEGVVNMCMVESKIKELQLEMKKLKEQKLVFMEQVMEYMEKKKIDCIPVSDMELMVIMKDVEKTSSINGKYIKDVLEKYYNENVNKDTSAKDKAEKTTEYIINNRKKNVEKIIKVQKLK